MALNQIKLQATEATSVDGGGTVSADVTLVEALLYIGVAGNVKVDVAGSGTGIVFVEVAAGSILPVKVNKIYTSGTTAEDIVALS
tara:strand:+ start:1867 stop:2121 length:255 start_codon:yes stop_codon:yes gene_type:complete